MNSRLKIWKGIRTGMWIQLCILLCMTRLSYTGLVGDHVCTVEENYLVNVTEYFIRDVTVRDYKWCLNVPPRCSFYTMRRVNESQVVEKNQTRAIEKCCPGFKEDATTSSCVPECMQCIHGLCENGGCSCFSGYMGKSCEQKCSSTHWGINCRHECNCGVGVCDPQTGICDCPPGYAGIRCADDCPKERYGRNCKEMCHCLVSQYCDPVSGLCIDIATTINPKQTEEKEYSKTTRAVLYVNGENSGNITLRKHSDPIYAKPTLRLYDSFDTITTTSKPLFTTYKKFSTSDHIREFSNRITTDFPRTSLTKTSGSDEMNIVFRNITALAKGTTYTPISTFKSRDTHAEVTNYIPASTPRGLPSKGTSHFTSFLPQDIASKRTSQFTTFTPPGIPAKVTVRMSTFTPYRILTSTSRSASKPIYLTTSVFESTISTNRVPTSQRTSYDTSSDVVNVPTTHTVSPDRPTYGTPTKASKPLTPTTEATSGSTSVTISNNDTKSTILAYENNGKFILNKDKLSEDNIQTGVESDFSAPSSISQPISNTLKPTTEKITPINNIIEIHQNFHPDTVLTGMPTRTREKNNLNAIDFDRIINENKAEPFQSKETMSGVAHIPNVPHEDNYLNDQSDDDVNSHKKENNLVSSISVPTALSIVVIIIALVIVIIRHFKKKNKENAVSPVETQQNGNISTVSVVTHSIFHTPLPEPPLVKNPLFTPTIDLNLNEGPTFETKVVCSMNFPTHQIDTKDPREYLYDHPPSTGSYRAASIPEPPESDTTTNAISTIQMEPVYDEIPCRGIVPPAAQASLTYDSSATLYMNTCGRTRF